MGAYSPFMKGPDFGGGIEDFVNRMMQMMMVSKMGQGQPSTSVGQSPINPMAGNRPMPQGMGAMMPPHNGNYGPQQPPMGGNEYGLTPDQLQQLMALMKTMGGPMGMMGGR